MKPTEDGVESQATAALKPLPAVVQIDECRIQAHLDAVGERR